MITRFLAGFGFTVNYGNSTQVTRFFKQFLKNVLVVQMAVSFF